MLIGTAVNQPSFVHKHNVRQIINICFRTTTDFDLDEYILYLFSSPCLPGYLHVGLAIYVIISLALYIHTYIHRRNLTNCDVLGENRPHLYSAFRKMQVSHSFCLNTFKVMVQNILLYFTCHLQLSSPKKSFGRSIWPLLLHLKPMYTHTHKVNPSSNKQSFRCEFGEGVLIHFHYKMLSAPHWYFNAQ